MDKEISVHECDTNLASAIFGQFAPLSTDEEIVHCIAPNLDSIHIAIAAGKSIIIYDLSTHDKISTMDFQDNKERCMIEDANIHIKEMNFIT